MGLLDLFRVKPSPAKFARLFIQRAMEKGFPPPMQFNKEEFQVLLGTNHVFNLHNAYREYCNAPKKGRSDVMDRYVAGLDVPAIPKNIEIAKARLMPSIRRMSQIEYLRLSARLSDPGKSFMSAHRVWDGDTATVIVYDSDTDMRHIDASQLSEWGLSFDQALQIAVDNLRDRTSSSFSDLGSGVTLGTWNDSYDSSRILLTDLLFRMSGDSDPIVMIPTRGRILVASGRNADGLLLMLSTAKYFLEQDGRPVSASMYKIENRALLVYSPDDPTVRETAEDLQKIYLIDDHSSQKDMLDKIHQKEGKDLYVAKFVVFKNEATGALTSHATWSKGVKSLLPQADVITLFQSGQTEADSVMKSVLWEDVQAMAGHLLLKDDSYPPRYLTVGFPDDATFASLPAFDLLPGA